MEWLAEKACLHLFFANLNGFSSSGGGKPLILTEEWRLERGKVLKSDFCLVVKEKQGTRSVTIAGWEEYIGFIPI